MKSSLGLKFLSGNEKSMSFRYHYTIISIINGLKWCGGDRGDGDAIDLITHV